ncbi:MAG: hypothetical protein AB1564_15375 [Chloroflexota bacterium]
MEIQEHENILVVIPNGFEEFFQVLFSAGRYGLFAILLLFGVATESPPDAIVGFVVVLVVGWLLLSIFIKEKMYRTIFNMSTQTLTTIIRSPWTLWIPRKKNVKFDDLTGITLKKPDGENVRLYMTLQGNIWSAFAGTASVKSAEKISRFLKIPLRIQMEEEIITHIPWVSDKEGTPYPTPCTKCGAPLPTIEPGMMNIKCSHCGMTMVITWSQGGISYQAAETTR